MSKPFSHLGHFSPPVLSAAILFAVLVVPAATSEPNSSKMDNRLDSNGQTAAIKCMMVDGNHPDKIVCVCDRATQSRCTDDLQLEWPTETGQVALIATTQSGLRFRSSRPMDTAAGHNVPSSSSSSSKISVNVSSRRQQILGWGGAITDAASININKLPRPLASQLLASYYAPNGLEYNLARVPIGGSDFSPRPYSYDDTPEPDLNLTHWTLAPEDLEHKIPVIKEIMQMVAASATATATPTAETSKLKLFASPWSPPKWMKSNSNFCRGHLIDSDEIYRAYAAYLINFFRAYRKQGIEFWGATVQNEPNSADLPFYFFNSLQMSSTEMSKFIGQYYGPALESFGYNKTNFKLIAGDDSLGFLNYHLPSVMHDKQVQRYVSGIAYHWYLSGLIVPYEALTRLLKSIENTGIEFVMMSEACQGAFLSRKHVDLGDWARAESYASDIIEDLKRQTSAWIDWNLALDLEGGPNWSGNFVDAPIIVDAQRELFYKQPMYYALAHFTKLMRPGSHVVDSQTTHGARLSGVTHVSAYRADTRHLIVNLLNRSNGARTFELEINHENTTHTMGTVRLEPRSVSSVVVKL